MEKKQLYLVGTLTKEKQIDANDAIYVHNDEEIEKIFQSGSYEEEENYFRIPLNLEELEEIFVKRQIEFKKVKHGTDTNTKNNRKH